MRGATLVVFGGSLERREENPFGFGSRLLADCWALDVATAVWFIAALEPPAADDDYLNGLPAEYRYDRKAVETGRYTRDQAPGPAPRSFGADGGGGAVLPVLARIVASEPAPPSLFVNLV